MLPAVSSVALAFARAGLPWDDAVVVSAHGRDPRPAVNVCRAYPKVAVLTGPGAGPAEIGAALAGLGPPRSWSREHLGSPRRTAHRVLPRQRCGPNLGGPQRGPRPRRRLPSRRPTSAPSRPGKVIVATTITKEADQRHNDHERNGVGPGADHPGWAWPRAATPAGWALGEGEFDSRDAVITKAEVRALALARLAPGPGLLVWDVGAGCGFVAVECARFGAAVIAVERDSQRCDRIRGNAARHAVDVRVQQGTHPGHSTACPRRTRPSSAAAARPWSRRWPGAVRPGSWWHWPR